MISIVQNGMVFIIINLTITTTKLNYTELGNYKRKKDKRGAKKKKR